MTRLAAAAAVAVLALAYAAHRWATTHPDDVEAAARIAAQAGWSWEHASHDVREVLRGHARAALGRRG